MFLNDWTLTFPADPGVSKHLRHAVRRAPDISRLFAPWARSRSNFNQTGECSGAFGGPKSLKRPSLLIYLLPCKEWPTRAFLEFKGNWIPPPASKLPFAPISTQICFFYDAGGGQPRKLAVFSRCQSASPSFTSPSAPLLWATFALQRLRSPCSYATPLLPGRAEPSTPVPPLSIN